MSTSIRQAFADTMLEVGQSDPNLVVLVGDISHFALQPFAKACPGRFYNIGICEPTIVNMAAGLAKVGFYPVVHTIIPFIVERSFEQIKLDFGYQRLGVNLVGIGSAFDYAALGCTHHCYDDFALLKNVEGCQIIYPASPTEFNRLFKQTYNNGLPTYFRVPEAAHNVPIPPEDIKMGKGVLLQTGQDLTIIAVGSQLKTVMESLQPLKDQGVVPEVIYIHTIKPLDEPLIAVSVAKTKRVIVIEEHGKYGGVADDVLRATVGLGVTHFEALNIGDRFIHEYGQYQQHCQRLGLSTEGVLAAVRRMNSK